MKAKYLLLAGVLAAGASGLAMAQGGPESLLPPGFDRPAARAPRAAPAKAPAAQPRFDVLNAPQAASQPTIAAQPVFATQPVAGPVATGPIVLPAGVTNFDQLMALPPEKLDQLLGLTPKYDIPPQAQRSMSRIGLLDTGEGGMAPFALKGQPASLVRAALAGNGGRMVSRWGHILLRRALASRLDAPEGMAPVEFAALRTGLLLRMGESDAARALAQDVDPGNYDAALTQAAMDAYIATADFTGFCPVLQLQASSRNDGRWAVMRSICSAYAGAAANGFADLDRLGKTGAMPKIDLLLAQKYAGAGGISGKRAVTIEWNGVSDMSPLRYGLTLAVGLTPPDTAMQGLPVSYDYVNALAPMVGLGLRADASDRAGAAGILSSAAMVDLYSQIYSNDDVKGGSADRALLLRDAYVGASGDDRVSAMQKLWDAGDAERRYARLVLTAYAAARLTPEPALASSAGDLIAAMLSAGLDGNAARWRSVVDTGSEGWAQLALGLPLSGAVDVSGIDTFRGNDKSDKQRRTAFLVAGLAGLGRINDSVRAKELGKIDASVDGQTRWTQAIDQAAAAGNPALVSLLAGLGMQGDSWARMTPRYLFHIVAALNRVGLNAEARMIAAEAVARA